MVSAPLPDCNSPPPPAGALVVPDRRSREGEVAVEHEDGAAATATGRVVLDDVIFERQIRRARHPDGPAGRRRAVLNGHALDGNAQGLPIRADVEDAVGGGQTVGLDRHRAAVGIVEDGETLQNVQVTRGIVVLIGTVECKAVFTGRLDFDHPSVEGRAGTVANGDCRP